MSGEPAPAETDLGSRHPGSTSGFDLGSRHPGSTSGFDLGNRHPTSSSYLVLWIVGLAIGWFEAAVVIDLRALLYPGGFDFPLEVMPVRLLAVEIVREACSLVLLAGIGYLASTTVAGRLGAFLFLFGVWDIVYYVALKLVLGWPASLGTWDLLFLIPLPWVGPVWAPALVAVEFIVVGTYLYWTASKPRAYSRAHVAVIVASAVVIVTSFLTEWRVVIELARPSRFHAWMYWMGLASGTAAFWHAERR
jgi:hypothetical protein